MIFPPGGWPPVPSAASTYPRGDRDSADHRPVVVLLFVNQGPFIVGQRAHPTDTRRPAVAGTLDPTVRRQAG